MGNIPRFIMSPEADRESVASVPGNVLTWCACNQRAHFMAEDGAFWVKLRSKEDMRAIITRSSTIVAGAWSDAGWYTTHLARTGKHTVLVLEHECSILDHALAQRSAACNADVPYSIRRPADDNARAWALYERLCGFATIATDGPWILKRCLGKEVRLWVHEFRNDGYVRREVLIKGTWTTDLILRRGRWMQVQ